MSPNALSPNGSPLHAGASPRARGIPDANASSAITSAESVSIWPSMRSKFASLSLPRTGAPPIEPVMPSSATSFAVAFSLARSATGSSAVVRAAAPRRSGLTSAACKVRSSAAARPLALNSRAVPLAPAASPPAVSRASSCASAPLLPRIVMLSDPARLSTAIARSSPVKRHQRGTVRRGEMRVELIVRQEQRSDIAGRFRAHLDAQRAGGAVEREP